MIEAKERMVVNLVSNMFLVFLRIFIAFLLTRYLLDALGVELYSLIPLVHSFIAFFEIFTMSFSTSIQRFVSIYVAKEDNRGGAVYFSSALLALLFICGFLCLPLMFFVLKFPSFFQIPDGYELSASIMTFIVILASFLTAISAPFATGTFIRHRFDLNCLAHAVSKIIQVVLLLILFNFFSPMLEIYGLSFIAMSATYLLLSMIIFRRLLPKISFDYRIFSWKALQEMGNMSTWAFINQIGSLLYLSISFTIVNIFLGPRAGGFFGAISQLIILVSVITGAISNVFTPIAYTYISAGKIESLVIQTQRACKYIGLLIAFPVGICCGLSVPLLSTWLGPSFVKFSPLACLLLIPWQINATIRPIFALFKGYNKVKLPAIATISLGILHIICSMLLISFTDLGLYAVGLSLLIFHSGKNLIFTPIYAAFIVESPLMVFQRKIYLGLTSALFIYFAALFLSYTINLATVPRLLVTTILLALLYFPLALLVACSKEERRWLYSLLKGRP